MKPKKTLIFVSVALLLLSACSPQTKNNTSKENFKILKNRVGNTDGNLLNDGLVDEEENWIYYSLDDGLYKAKEDGTNKIKLSDMTARDINVVNDTVYFRHRPDGIYKINNSGGTASQVSPYNSNGGLFIFDKYIVNGTNELIELDGSNRKIISEDYTPNGGTLNIDDDGFYLQTKTLDGKDKVVKLSFDGNVIKEIFDGQHQPMQVKDNWIYFANNNDNKALYKIKTDGTGEEKIIEKWVMNINIVDDWIYYTTNDGLYKIKIDGSSNKMLLNIPVSDINIINNWIYYVKRSKADSYSKLYRIKIDGSTNEIFATKGEVSLSTPSNEKATVGKKSILNKIYTTRFGEVNNVTYPKFSFNYSDNWSVTTQNVSGESENVVLKNNKGITIEFNYFAYPKDFNFGGNSTFMRRVNIKKVKYSQFIPGYIQATDYSELGKFSVVSIKETGNMNSQTDSTFKDIDGYITYGVLPDSFLGTKEDLYGLPITDYSFYYGGHISFLAISPDGKFSSDEEYEIKEILSTFRVN